MHVTVFMCSMKAVPLQMIRCKCVYIEFTQETGSDDGQLLFIAELPNLFEKDL